MTTTRDTGPQGGAIMFDSSITCIGALKWRAKAACLRTVSSMPCRLQSSSVIFSEDGKRRAVRRSVCK